MKLSANLLLGTALSLVLTATAWTQNSASSADVATTGNSRLAKWFARVNIVQDSQPRWIVPLATSTGRLEEAYHYDQIWQENARGGTTNSFGGGKGLSVIPCSRMQVNVNLPPYVTHTNSQIPNGWGDISFLMKYRVLSANEERGNYVLSAFFGLSWPTGQHQNGSPHPVMTPTIAYGKGYNHFSLQGTTAVSLPTTETGTLGRIIIVNNALQYQTFGKFWPEVELNSSFFQDGQDAGRKQNFVTPGLIVGRLKLIGRIRLAFGGGFQIATTHFHKTNHNTILSIRFPF